MSMRQIFAQVPAFSTQCFASESSGDEIEVQAIRYTQYVVQNYLNKAFLNVF